MADFRKKVLIIGYGAVSQCTLPILLKHVKIPFENITIIDIEDKSKPLKEWKSKGVKFFQQQITPENLSKVIDEHLEHGGLLIDLAWNIDCYEILKACHERDILYVNTSVEVWDSKSEMLTKTTFEKTLYYRHMQLKEKTKGWENSVTAVLDHGANPGLISHFTKRALIDITHRLIKDKKVSPVEGKSLLALSREHKFGELAMNLGVKVIHCSERDTQVTSKPKQVNECVGTWSIEGLREEGSAPAEIGWGLHEKELPKNSVVPPYGPKNQICLSQMGMNTWIRSWIPDEEIVGMVIRHGEAFGISDRFTVYKNGKPIYRPTVHYAYMTCHETISSLHELRGRNYELQPKLRIMYDDIVSGADILGALVMGHKYNSWWTGSILNIEEARRLVPNQNATTVQVALGVVTAVRYMLENPRKGILLPDDLPHEFVLPIAMQYLGKWVSEPYDWTPLKNRTVFFIENKKQDFDKSDPWQFKNFLFVP